MNQPSVLPVPLNPPFQAKLKLAASLDEISAAFAASKSSKASAVATELIDKTPGGCGEAQGQRRGGEVPRRCRDLRCRPALLQHGKLIETRPNVIATLAALEAAADSEDEEEGGDGWGGEEEEEEEEEGELSDEEGEEDMDGEGSEEETEAELGGGTRTKRPRG